ncbi:hypothetical protein ACS5PN_22520 [Roseateles sp. NT4]|uniref:hypothetical protein n=1 Tax=Roseateles sp. NT4 TaxID=3453715 RepID=UPI003EE962B4
MHTQTYDIPEARYHLWLLPLFCAAAYAVGLVTIPKNALALGGFAIVPGAFVCNVIGFVSQRSIWKRHDYAWYRQTFPEAVQAHGRLRCRHCGGERLSLRNLMNHSYTRAHVCEQCGKTLYFSPEGN